MADFCKQCSIDILGEDFQDLKGITLAEHWEKGLACSAICEGCGPIQINPDGECVSEGCLESGKPGHGLPWVKEEK